MKKLQELTLFDKFLFDETMDIPEAHEAVLQIIFGDDNLKLLTPAQTEKGGVNIECSFIFYGLYHG
jgi:hypothetical protein